MFDALIKVGGSLCRRPNLPDLAVAWSELSTRHRLLWLPGGGDFANQVRAADGRFGLGDSAAHWMAILAMEQTAHLLADLMPDAALVNSLPDAVAACANRRPAVLAPFVLLRQLDPLPHRWQVTSDSIAAWLAGFAGIPRLILLKSVEGVFLAGAEGDPPKLAAQISPQALPGYNIVDEDFAGNLPPNADCWLLDGSRPERLAQLLRNGSAIGTRITKNVKRKT
ncbi:MAG: amino acid kinase [Anaerolineae bacterium]